MLSYIGQLVRLLRGPFVVRIHRGPLAGAGFGFGFGRPDASLRERLPDYAADGRVVTLPPLTIQRIGSL